jgi:hypothetical protein
MTGRFVAGSVGATPIRATHRPAVVSGLWASAQPLGCRQRQIASSGAMIWLKSKSSLFDVRWKMPAPRYRKLSIPPSWKLLNIHWRRDSTVSSPWTKKTSFIRRNARNATSSSKSVFLKGALSKQRECLFGCYMNAYLSSSAFLLRILKSPSSRLPVIAGASEECQAMRLG